MITLEEAAGRGGKEASLVAATGGRASLAATFLSERALFTPDGEKTARLLLLMLLLLQLILLFDGVGGAACCSEASAAVAACPTASKVSSQPGCDPGGAQRDTWSRTARTTSSNDWLRTSREVDESPTLRIDTMRSPIEIEPQR